MEASILISKYKLRRNFDPGESFRLEFNPSELKMISNHFEKHFESRFMQIG